MRDVVAFVPPPSLPLTPAAFILLLSVSVRERERVVTYRTWQCRLLLLGCQCISPESVERVLFLCFVSPFVDIVVCTIVFFIRISLYRFRCVYIFSRTSLFVCDMLCPSSSSSSSSSLHCHPFSLLFRVAAREPLERKRRHRGERATHKSSLLKLRGKLEEEKPAPKSDKSECCDDVCASEIYTEMRCTQYGDDLCIIMR